MTNDPAIRGPGKGTLELVKKAILFDLTHEQSSRESLTHFISIPLNLNSSLTSSFDAFKAEVVAVLGPSSESYFISPKRLHLTITVLTLTSPDAISMTKKLIDEAIKQSNLLASAIPVSGLGILHGIPSKCSVLFAKVEIGKELQKATENILTSLLEADVAGNLSVTVT